MVAENECLDPLVVITGPTATGKSRIGVLVAELVDGEIVSADSMLVYKGMEIGTAKPAGTEMHNIPHHLIDIVNPDQEYSVALFQKQARANIADILGRNKLPVMVGGAGLYIKAVIDGYDFSSARGSEHFRNKLLKESDDKGPESLHRRLSKIDPQAASNLHPKDVRRVIRALEVYSLTDRPISSYHKMLDQPLYELYMFGLTMGREKLYRRIEQRVDNILAAGLIEEVSGLLKQGYSKELNSMRGIGYKEIAAYLAGEVSLEKAIEILKRNTRRYAKRQLTFFRRDSRIKWFNVCEYDDSLSVAKEIIGCLKKEYRKARRR